MTKLERILTEMGWTQRDLQRAIENKFGVKIGDDRISKLYTGRLKDIKMKTAKMIASTLNVTIDEICEM